MDTQPQADQTAAQQPPAERERPKLEWKHIVSISFALGISLLIFLYHERLGDLQELAYVGAFIAMLIGNATVILPVPGLIIVYLLGSTLNPLLLGLSAGPGAALGEMTAYFAGYGGSALIDNMKLYQTVKRWMERYGLVVIAVMAAIPNPVFDMAGIVAGSLKLKWWQFLIAAAIGKIIQSTLIAYAGAFSIGWVRGFLD